jgi:glycosyltransferase involved in cell wall biosynthesis
VTASREGGGRKVALLGSYGPSLIIFRGALIKDLVARGHQVIAMAPDIAPSLAEQLRALGAEPLQTPMVNNSLNPLSMLKSLNALRQVFSATRPDALIAYTIKPVTLGSLAASWAKVGNIVGLITGLGFAFTEGNGARRKVSRLAATFLYRRALRRNQLVIFQNPDDRDYFRDHDILSDDTRSIVVRGSGVELDKFAPAPLPGKPVFLMVARLIGDKGVREFADAARRLKAKYPETAFHLAGWFDDSPDGIKREELARMEADGVEYLGKLDDIRPALAAASVFVLPSRYREGTPRSSLEAMSMGRAVVTTDTPGCRETVINGDNGFLVPPRDPDALFEAMERFIVEPELSEKMGARSRKLAEERFDVAIVNRMILDAAGL